MMNLSQRASMGILRKVCNKKIPFKLYINFILVNIVNLYVYETGARNA